VTISLCLSALFVIALTALMWMEKRTSRETAARLEASYLHQIDSLRSSHLEQMEAMAQSSILIQTQADRMVAMAESAMRGAEATARSATEQMATTVEKITSMLCQTVSPPQPPQSSDGVTIEQRLADSQPWTQFLSPTEQREEEELQAQRRRLAARAAEEAAPAAGWVNDPQAIQDLVVHGPPPDETMAASATMGPMWGFDPSL
jgi:hypothetical protein